MRSAIGALGGSAVDHRARSRHLVDPDLLPLVERTPNYVLTAENVTEVRAKITQAVAEEIFVPDVENVSDLLETEWCIPGLAGGPDVRVLGFRPRKVAGPLPALLYLHGGGYVLFSADTFARVSRAHAAALQCAVFSVDYRLAPESRHPGPINDCFAALTWLHRSADALDVDPARIGVKGESAGGGLAAALALLARDREGPPLAFQHLMYPMLDDRTGTIPPTNQDAGAYVWDGAANRFGWGALLGTEPGGADVPCYAASARVVDLQRLPPTFIAVGSLDLFVDENLDYAHRLLRAGVPVEFHVYPGGVHGFDLLGDVPLARAAHRDSQQSLSVAFSRPSTKGIML